MNVNSEKNVYIRLAQKEDVSAIGDLYIELFAITETLQPKFWKKAEQDRNYLEKVINGDSADIFVVQARDELVGFALVTEQETPPYACVVKHRYAYLMDIAVKETFRGKGIGKMLLKAVTAWAKQRKLDYLELNVLSNNTGAIKLYEQNGYKTTMLTMKHMLS